MSPNSNNSHNAAAAAAAADDTLSEPAMRPLPLGVFPSPLTIAPRHPERHDRTFILLHGRGFNPKIFADSLFLTRDDSGSRRSSSSSAGNNPSSPLHTAFPTARFVLPSAPRQRATLYRRSVVSQWYDGSGDWEAPAAVLGDAAATVEYVHRLVRREMAALGGPEAADEAEAARGIVLGGFSQGCAAALLCLLLWAGPPLGGFLGLCGMMPVGRPVEDVLDERESEGGEDGGVLFAEDDEDEDDEESVAARGEGEDDGMADSEDEARIRCAVAFLRCEADVPTQPRLAFPLPFQQTPIFMGHGTEDVNVEPRYGRDAVRILRKMGCEVGWREYKDLGHEPSREMLSDAAGFLGTAASHD